MRKQNVILRILIVAAYLALMAISTWATVESGWRLLPGWPIAFIWIFSIIFFWLASYGTHQIILSLNKAVRVNRRFIKLMKGIVILGAFWGLLILPTNTHTFFYKSVIKDYTVAELKFTESKLKDLLNKGEAGKIIDQEKKDFENEILGLFGQYESEINNPGLPGNGNRAEKILAKLQEKLGGEIQRLNLVSNHLSDRREFIDAMRSQVIEKLKLKLNEYDLKLANINKGIDQNEITHLVTEIQEIEDRIQALKENRLSVEAAKETEKEPRQATIAILTSSLQLIGKYSDDLKRLYPQIPALLDYRIPKIRELDSVIQVWKNFFAGDYKARGFIFWIIVASLIDFAGFITYSIAFYTEESN